MYCDGKGGPVYTCTHTYEEVPTRWALTKPRDGPFLSSSSIPPSSAPRTRRHMFSRRVSLLYLTCYHIFLS